MSNSGKALSRQKTNGRPTTRDIKAQKPPTKAQILARRERWVKALESGKYPQTKEALRDESGYCCLGVACDLYAKATHKGYWDRFLFRAGDNVEIGGLPEPVQQWLGLGERLPCLPSGKHLAHLNDQGKNFKQIAAMIRRHFIEKE